MSELKCMTAEVRRRVIELIKNDKEQEAQAANKSQQKIPLRR